MELFEYIKSQLPQMPNSAIMKQLGASDELIEYVKETPENTNFAIAEVIEGSGGGDMGEVWLVGNEYIDTSEGRMFDLSNVDSTDHIAELISNAENYTVYLNNEELPLIISSNEGAIWADGTEETATKNIQLYPNDISFVLYSNPSTAPTAVEVSVKHK